MENGGGEQDRRRGNEDELALTLGQSTKRHSDEDELGLTLGQSTKRHRDESELALTLGQSTKRHRDEDELTLTLGQSTKRHSDEDELAPTLGQSTKRHRLISPTTTSVFASPPSRELNLFNNNRDIAGPDNGHGLQPNKYDVFISFRGTDVRETFLSHLYTHLNDLRKLAVYKDDVDLQRGMEISPTLLRAIERSDVYIVILSPNYTDSSWCLDELEKILDCKERYGRSVIPVFYGVDPSDIENQKLPSTTTAGFGKVESWRAALKEIATLSGFDSKVIRK